MEEKYFNNTLFTEEGHTYHNGQKSLISVTTFIKQFTEPFDEYYWSHYKAAQANGYKVTKKTFTPDKYIYTKVLPEDILRDWNNKKLIGTSVGTFVHNYLENIWRRKIISSPFFNVEINDRINKIIPHAHQFYLDYKNKIKPFKLEYVISNNYLAGQIDGLFETNKGLCIVDYKTDKEIKYYNKFQNFKYPFEYLDDCNYNKYRLQLSLYKYILESETDYKVTNVIIVHLTPKGYKIIKPKLIDIEWQQLEALLVNLEV